MNKELKNKIKDWIKDHPVIIDFFNRAMIDDILIVGDILKEMDIANKPSKMSLDEYYFLNQCVEEISEELCDEENDFA